MITANNVSKTYSQTGNILRVLRNVSIEIGKGELMAIIGPSGAGKSTLLHILGGLDKPTEGAVEYEGQDIYTMSDEKRSAWRNSKVGFVFQSYYLIPELTALENVVLPVMVKNNSRKTSQIEDMGVKLLEKVGLRERVMHRSSQLSGGEQQRVAIARALVNSPEVLFCDEPTGNLDSASGQKVMDILLSLNATHQQSVVVVTHDERISQRVSRVIKIKDGQSSIGVGMKIYFNGELVGKNEAKVSVFDHGFLYGDGAFEGIRAYEGVVFRLKEHIERLYETLHTLLIDPQMTKKQMTDAVVATLKANKIKNGYIRLIVSRGDGDLGLDPRKCFGKPNVIIIADNIVLYPPALYEKGMEIITVATTKNNVNALNPQLKSLNYLNNILAKIEATHCGYNEAIMLDSNGYVGECTGDNVFIVKNGVLSTPHLARLEGITAQAILDLADGMKVKTQKGFITRHEVYNADECFLTGTAAELIPIVKVDGRVIGTGKPGVLTGKLLKAFRALAKKDGLSMQCDICAKKKRLCI